ncbi:hypothetical protein, partial [Caballeronia glebae]|uniref:hypothetical protein n=1 Tax=Caballeronia glebae TaxID=1777143 RepID=UPI001F2538BC
SWDSASRCLFRVSGRAFKKGYFNSLLEAHRQLMPMKPVVLVNETATGFGSQAIVRGSGSGRGRSDRPLPSGLREDGGSDLSDLFDPVSAGTISEYSKSAMPNQSVELLARKSSTKSGIRKAKSIGNVD